MSSEDEVGEKLPGIQLALFELIWPTFDWIDTIYIAISPSICSVHVRATSSQPQSELDDCERLLGEIFDVALAGTSLSFEIHRNRCLPSKDGYREVMSQAIFKEIAKDVAPWRLDMGR